MRIGSAGWPTRLLPPNVLYCILLALLSPTPISLFGRGRRLSAPAKAPADDAPRLAKPAPDDDVRPEPSRRVPEAVLLERCEEALREAGLREPAAAHVASALVAAQRDGKEAHGLGRLRAIISSLKDGTADGDAEPVVETLSPSLLRRPLPSCRHCRVCLRKGSGPILRLLMPVDLLREDEGMTDWQTAAVSCTTPCAAQTHFRRE